MEIHLLSNTMAPYVAWGVGGDASLSFPYSMLATLLAGVVERPFVTIAGFRRGALVYSLRANIFSWALGVALMFIIMASNEFLLYSMIALSVPFSILVEGRYLARVAYKLNIDMRWWPIVVGNIVSAVMLVGILFVGLERGDELQRSQSTLVQMLAMHASQLYLVVFVVCLFAFVALIFMPWPTRDEEPVVTHQTVDRA